MNVIETINGELYKAVPHYPSRSYEKDVYHRRTEEEIAEHIDKQYQECEDAGNKVHTWKKWSTASDTEKEYYRKHFRVDDNKVIGRETVQVGYPQSGWFVFTDKWCRIFPEVEVVEIWDER